MYNLKGSHKWERVAVLPLEDYHQPEEEHIFVNTIGYQCRIVYNRDRSMQSIEYNYPLISKKDFVKEVKNRRYFSCSTRFFKNNKTYIMELPW